MQGSTHPGAVTPTGVRDGDPAALEALCARRGAAVLAFCHEVCEPEYVYRAAAEAFARFRAAVVVLDDFTGIDPDGLLLGATRHAAAALARSSSGPPRLRGLRGRGHSEACSFIPEMLVARAGGSLSEADAERLDEHLARCAGCREVEAAFARAEHAYRTPPDATVPRSAARAIVAALAAAAPVRAPAEHHEPDAATTELEAVPADPAVEYLPEPEYEEELEDYEEAEAESAAPPPAYEEEPEPAYEEEPEPAYEEEPEPAYEEEPEPVYDEPEPPEVPATVVAPPAAVEPVSTALPRQRRRPHVHWPGHMPHVEPDRMRDVVLPAAVVIIALICAMGIAGVFGGPEPAPPTGSATAAEPVFPVGSAGAPARETAAGAAAEIARQARREQRRAERLRAERLRRARRSASPSADNAESSPGTDSPAQAQPPSTTRTPPAPGRSNRDDAGRLDAGRTGQGVGVTPADQEPDAPLDPGSYESGTGGAAPPG